MPRFQLDESNPGWIKAWVVFRNSPWHLQGAYPSRIEVDVFRAAMGGDYDVAYGAHRLATDDFIREDENEIASTPKTATRWVKGHQFLELEGAIGDKGSVLIINTNIPWEQLPLELREQHSLAQRDECMTMHRVARAWSVQAGFQPEGGA